ncbi:hypothetical protein EAI_06159 [Harpegnathos saltator]|uniref:Mitochondrial splicing suppressor 51-like C-terminal domain-containing protein n=1 Tax=Harpegnathos saltator TaxID=610380 RepID=E2C9N6_HARSA|nr:hypothetical protein EAI_06159 [Harpegnathos saltator]
MTRPLFAYETLMILYAKSCLVCHRQTELTVCRGCYCVNFCSDHTEGFEMYHSPHCMLLKIYLNLHLALMVIAVPPIYENISVFPPEREERSLSNMRDFLGFCIYQEDERWAGKPWTDDLLLVKDYNYSVLLSEPMTIYYGMEDANWIRKLLKPVCIVHVIFSIPMAGTEVLVWEILLHLLFSRVQRLVIVFIEQDTSIAIGEVELCERCKAHEKRIDFERTSLAYEEYISGMEYERPNIIVMFQARVTKFTRAFVMEAKHQRCPLLITTESEEKSDQILRTIHRALDAGNARLSIYQGENRFRSFVPIKAFRNEGVTYYNRYLVILEDLGDPDILDLIEHISANRRPIGRY